MVPWTLSGRHVGFMVAGDVIVLVALQVSGLGPGQCVAGQAWGAVLEVEGLL